MKCPFLKRSTAFPATAAVAAAMLLCLPVCALAPRSTLQNREAVEQFMLVSRLNDIFVVQGPLNDRLTVMSLREVLQAAAERVAFEMDKQDLESKLRDLEVEIAKIKRRQDEFFVWEDAENARVNQSYLALLALLENAFTRMRLSHVEENILRQITDNETLRRVSLRANVITSDETELIYDFLDKPRKLNDALKLVHGTFHKKVYGSASLNEDELDFRMLVEFFRRGGNDYARKLLIREMDLIQAKKLEKDLPVEAVLEDRTLKAALMKSFERMKNDFDFVRENRDRLQFDAGTPAERLFDSLVRRQVLSSDGLLLIPEKELLISHKEDLKWLNILAFKRLFPGVVPKDRETRHFKTSEVKMLRMYFNNLLVPKIRQWIDFIEAIRKVRDWEPIEVEYANGVQESDSLPESLIKGVYLLQNPDLVQDKAIEVFPKKGIQTAA